MFVKRAQTGDIINESPEWHVDSRLRRALVWVSLTLVCAVAVAASVSCFGGWEYRRDHMLQIIVGADGSAERLPYQHGRVWQQVLDRDYAEETNNAYPNDRYYRDASGDYWAAVHLPDYVPNGDANFEYFWRPGIDDGDDFVRCPRGQCVVHLMIGPADAIVDESSVDGSTLDESMLWDARPQDWTFVQAPVDLRHVWESEASVTTYPLITVRIGEGAFTRLGTGEVERSN